ncbi:MAG: hypothetical protein ACOCZ8_04785, partial [Bacteroidota bacterium]
MRFQSPALLLLLFVSASFPFDGTAQRQIIEWDTLRQHELPLEHSPDMFLAPQLLITETDSIVYFYRRENESIYRYRYSDFSFIDTISLAQLPTSPQLSRKHSRKGSFIDAHRYMWLHPSHYHRQGYHDSVCYIFDIREPRKLQVVSLVSEVTHGIDFKPSIDFVERYAYDHSRFGLCTNGRYVAVPLSISGYNDMNAYGQVKYMRDTGAVVLLIDLEADTLKATPIHALQYPKPDGPQPMHAWPRSFPTPYVSFWGDDRLLLGFTGQDSLQVYDINTGQLSLIAANSVRFEAPFGRFTQAEIDSMDQWGEMYNSRQPAFYATNTNPHTGRIWRAYSYPYFTELEKPKQQFASVVLDENGQVFAEGFMPANGQANIATPTPRGWLMPDRSRYASEGISGFVEVRPRFVEAPEQGLEAYLNTTKVPEVKPPLTQEQYLKQFFEFSSLPKDDTTFVMIIPPRRSCPACLHTSEIYLEQWRQDGELPTNLIVIASGNGEYDLKQNLRGYTESKSRFKRFYSDVNHDYVRAFTKLDVNPVTVKVAQGEIQDAFSLDPRVIGRVYGMLDYKIKTDPV